MGWKDATTFETEFVIAASVNGSEFVVLDDPVPSTTRSQLGAQYSFTSRGLPANLTLRFRVQARNAATGQVSSFSLPTAECSTGYMPANATGCFVGTMSMQGRSNHTGAWAYFNGFPVARSDASGHFEICGARPGSHAIGGRGKCYLRSDTPPLAVQAGQRVDVSSTSLYGGDVNDDNHVNLFDLVRVGSDYRSAPPNDPDADCNQDGRVDLFDLVLVGSNYRMDGPVPWGFQKPVVANPAGGLPAGEPRAAGSPVGGSPAGGSTFGARSLRLVGSPLGQPVTLRTRRLGAGTVAVDVAVVATEPFYGVDLSLAFDPARVAVVDALGGVPGTQIQPGDVWQASHGVATVPLNVVDEAAGRASFAASRLRPMAALTGEVVVARAILRGVNGGDPTGAYSLDMVRLADARGRSVEARWWGIARELVERIWLPWGRR